MVRPFTLHSSLSTNGTISYSALDDFRRNHELCVSCCMIAVGLFMLIFQGAYAFVEAIVVVRSSVLRYATYMLTTTSADPTRCPLGCNMRHPVQFFPQRETHNLGLARLCGVYLRFRDCNDPGSPATILL